MIPQGANNQVENLEEKLPPTRGEGSSKPRMPFRSALKLTRDQEDELVSHALNRIDQIEKQLGKHVGSEGSEQGEFSVTCDQKSHFGKRQRYTARYYNHVEDRAVKGTVFEHSNVTASLSQRITAQMIAKSSTFFFGQPDDTEWFTAEGIGIEDATLADKVKKYARFVVNECDIKGRHIQANEFAWVRGESVIKTVHREQFQVFQRTATILVESEDPKSEPILDAYGDYIVSGDAVIDEMAETPVDALNLEQAPIQIEQNEAATAELPDGVAPTPAAEAAQATMLVPTGNKLLKRDGVTPIPQNPVYRTEVITKKLVTFEGPDSRICYYLDFLAPIDASGIQPGEADLIAHLYDKSVMDVAQMFAGQYAEGDDGVADFQAAVTLLRDMLAETAQAKSAEGQPRADFQEQDTDASRANPRVQLAECWMTYDANGDGFQEEILLIVDRRRRAPVFYEYTGNVTLRGLRPFEVVSPMTVDGRWWGMGAMEYFDPEQEFIDLQINRKNFRDGGSGRITFWAPWATMEGQRDRRLKCNNGQTYTLREGYKAEQALTYITLPDDTSDLKEMIDLFAQFMQVKSGVLTGADRSIAGLPSSETLGEEQMISESGDELFGMFLIRLHRGLSRALAAVVDVAFAQLNQKKVFTFFNGQGLDVLELTPDDVRDLGMNVRFSITRTRDRQILQSGNVADAVIDGFYNRPLPLQERTAIYAQSRLKALKVPQPDTIIMPTDPASYMPPPPPAG